MKQIVILFCLYFIILPSFSQFTDNFSDDNFSQYPKWIGDTSHFEIDTLQQLHLIAPTVSGSSFLCAVSNISKNAEWEFYVKMDFNPSGSNYAKVYLIADSANLKAALKGYFIKIGNTNDEVSLYRQDGSTSVEIISGTDKRLNSTPVTLKIKVSRNALGEWTLLSDTLGGNNYYKEGAVVDTTYNFSYFFGVVCVYTSTRSDKFFFDDFVIKSLPSVDTIAPIISSVIVSSDTTLTVQFSEPIKKESAELITNYFVNKSIGSPAKATIDNTDNTKVHLIFNTPFTNATNYLLSIQNIEDTSGNVLVKSDWEFNYFVSVHPAWKDIVINEIFADPTPSNGLPEAEFVELYNRSNKIIDVNGWTFSDASNTVSLSKYYFMPNTYLVLCSMVDTTKYSTYSRVMGVTALPTLNNDEDILSLQDSNGQVVDAVHYLLSWYHHTTKDDGGWSLEMLNPWYECKDIFNWTSSVSPLGGTPGTENSVFDTLPDSIAPTLTAVDILSDKQLLVTFSESMDSISLLHGSYTISNGITVDSVKVNSTGWTSVVVDLKAPLIINNFYSLNVKNSTDCQGNRVDNHEFQFVLPEQGEKLDIIINEVLFNPREYGSDFVEVYNRSKKMISLQNWQLANYDTYNDSIANQKPIINKSFVIFPESYVVLTKDSLNIQKEYFYYKDRIFIQMSSLPSYNDDEGTVILLNNSSEVIDSFCYNENLHFPLLYNKEGVSLERIDYNRATSDISNWHSAAEDIGFATPGYQNSQFFTSNGSNATITLEPEIFSPDNDGYNDIVTIHYKMVTQGNVTSIHIYDSQGRIIKHLVNNELLSAEGTFSWDGTNDNREKARIGMYIIYFEAFGLDGNVISLKKTVVLAAKLN